MSLEILIADQDVELANLYCRFLADHGFSAHRVECGLECLKRVNRQVPDVLVLDRGLARFFPLAALLDGIQIAVKSKGKSRYVFNYEVSQPFKEFQS